MAKMLDILDRVGRRYLRQATPRELHTTNGFDINSTIDIHNNSLHHTDLHHSSIRNALTKVSYIVVVVVIQCAKQLFTLSLSIHFHNYLLIRMELLRKKLTMITI
jgi:hypothetical protein